MLLSVPYHLSRCTEMHETATCPLRQTPTMMFPDVHTRQHMMCCMRMESWATSASAASLATCNIRRCSDSPSEWPAQDLLQPIQQRHPCPTSSPTLPHPQHTVTTPPAQCIMVTDLVSAALPAALLPLLLCCCWAAPLPAPGTAAAAPGSACWGSRNPVCWAAW